MADDAAPPHFPSPVSDQNEWLLFKPMTWDVYGHPTTPGNYPYFPSPPYPYSPITPSPRYTPYPHPFARQTWSHPLPSQDISPTMNPGLVRWQSGDLTPSFPSYPSVQPGPCTILTAGNRLQTALGSALPAYAMVTPDGHLPTKPSVVGMVDHQKDEESESDGNSDSDADADGETDVEDEDQPSSRMASAVAGNASAATEVTLAPPLPKLDVIPAPIVPKKPAGLSASYCPRPKTSAVKPTVPATASSAPSSQTPISPAKSAKAVLPARQDCTPPKKRAKGAATKLAPRRIVSLKDLSSEKLPVTPKGINPDPKTTPFDPSPKKRSAGASSTIAQPAESIGLPPFQRKGVPPPSPTITAALRSTPSPSSKRPSTPSEDSPSKYAKTIAESRTRCQLPAIPRYTLPTNIALPTPAPSPAPSRSSIARCVRQTPTYSSSPEAEASAVASESELSEPDSEDESDDDFADSPAPARSSGSGSIKGMAGRKRGAGKGRDEVKRRDQNQSSQAKYRIKMAAMQQILMKFFVEASILSEQMGPSASRSTLRGYVAEARDAIKDADGSQGSKFDELMLALEEQRQKVKKSKT